MKTQVRRLLPGVQKKPGLFGEYVLVRRTRVHRGAGRFGVSDPRGAAAYLSAALRRWAAVSPRRPTGTTPVAAPRPYAGMSTYTDS